jgi:toxin ParE1/3/4
LLGQYPFAGRSREDLRAGYRSFPVGQYLILYRVADPGIRVMQVLQGRRDIAALFEH